MSEGAQMDEQPFALACSPVEAYYLAGLLGATSLPGMSDPFSGWLANEIEAAWAEARASLIQRRFIEERADGGLVIDMGVAALMNTWAMADVSIWLTGATQDGHSLDTHFHLKGSMAVEQRVIDDGSIRLAPVENVIAVYREIIRRLRLSGQAPASGNRCALPEAVLERARTLAVNQGVRAAADTLSRAAIPAETAEALAKTLVSPTVNGAVVALGRGRIFYWEVAGLGMLDGAVGLWRLRAFKQEGENWIEVIPCDASGMRIEVQRILNRFLSEPLPPGL